MESTCLPSTSLLHVGMCNQNCWIFSVGATTFGFCPWFCSAGAMTMSMWTMNLKRLSAGKDLAGVTQERPLPLKSRAQCVPSTVCRTRLRTPPAFSFSTYTAGWRPHSLTSLIRLTQRVEHCELCRALSWAALKEVHRKFLRCVCFQTIQCSGTCFCALHPFLKVSLTIIVMDALLPAQAFCCVVPYISSIPICD